MKRDASTAALLHDLTHTMRNLREELYSLEREIERERAEHTLRSHHTEERASERASERARERARAAAHAGALAEKAARQEVSAAAAVRGMLVELAALRVYASAVKEDVEGMTRDRERLRGFIDSITREGEVLEQELCSMMEVRQERDVMALQVTCP
jgi:hypothetical protein